MSYENQEYTEHLLHGFHPNCEYCHESQNMLSAMLKDMKGTKMQDQTLFGKLSGFIPPYGSTKHDNMDNPTNVVRG